MKPQIERDRVRSFIMSELLKGKIKIGERLSLPYFSEKLKCSVTPIREALTQLEYAKIIEVVPNRGFIIPELSAREARNIYQLIAALELLALENSNFTKEDLKALKRLQLQFQNSKDNFEKIHADFELHEHLTQNYDNPLVHQKIRDIKVRILSYEIQFMDNVSLASNSNDLHKRLIQAIEKKNAITAARLLKQNWYVTLDFIQNNFK